MNIKSAFLKDPITLPQTGIGVERSFTKERTSSVTMYVEGPFLYFQVKDRPDVLAATPLSNVATLIFDPGVELIKKRNEKPNSSEA